MDKGPFIKLIDKSSIFIIIPHKNGAHHLQRLLPSLFSSYLHFGAANFTTVLVEDSSSDESIEYVKINFPSIKIIKNRRKRGFAGSINTGILYALSHGADRIAICNNDVMLRSNSWSIIQSVFSNNSNVGVLGFREIAPIDECEFFECSINEQSIKCSSVGAVPGCFFLCSKEAFLRTGLFDEDYFMYGEDNDFFYRLHINGNLILQSNFPVWHFGEGSSAGNLSTTWLAYRNALRFAIKNTGLPGSLRMFLSLLNQGCNPFLHKSQQNPVICRMRRYNILSNFFILSASLAWNLLKIKSTLKSKTTYILHNTNMN